MLELAELKADVLATDWEGNGSRGELQAVSTIFSFFGTESAQFGPSEGPNIRGETALGPSEGPNIREETALLPPSNATAEASFLGDLGHLP